MHDNLDDIFDEAYVIPPIPKPLSKFKFCKGDELKFDQYKFYIYEVTTNYVTIMINEGLATARLMEYMETIFDAVYVGPMLQWPQGAHLTFRKKTSD